MITFYEVTYACKQCWDEPGGWLIASCPSQHCGRFSDHVPHPYAVKCPHWLRQYAAAIKGTAQTAMAKGDDPSPTFRDLQDLEAGIYRFAHAVTDRRTAAQRVPF